MKLLPKSPEDFRYREPRRLVLRKNRGFTLVELLVSMTVLAVLLAIISQVLATVQRSWRSTSAKVSQFREARRAYDVIKRNLAQATLNTYLHYDFGGNKDQTTGFIDTTAAPTGYIPFSELQFVCGPSNGIAGAQLDPAKSPGHAVFFQANLGFSDLYPSLPTTLNPRGYFIEFGDDQALRPSFLNGKVAPRVRYRLMEYAPPTEANTIYDATRRLNGTNNTAWIQNVPTWSRPVADNVAALYFAPKRPQLDGAGDPYAIAPGYVYDSAAAVAGGAGTGNARHELPPQMDVIMIVVDEASAEMLTVGSSGSGSPPLDLGRFFNQASTDQIRQDLDEIEKMLVEMKVNFRIYVSTITLPNSKWRG